MKHMDINILQRFKKKKTEKPKKKHIKILLLLLEFNIVRS